MRRKVMAAVVFLVTLLSLSAYGKSLLEDIPPPRLGPRPPLSGGKSLRKLGTGPSIFSLLSRKSVKKILSKAVLKQWPLPKLSFKDVDLGSTNKVKTTAEQNKMNAKEEITSAVGKGVFGFPKLIAGAPKLTRKVNGESGSKRRLTGGKFRFLEQQPKQTWLMGIDELQTETCFTILYNETITSEGCDSVTRQNRICRGRCNSFFVPTLESDFKSCSSCTPTRLRNEYVTLRCPKDKFGFRVKKIQIILDCKCQSMMSC